VPPRILVVDDDPDVLFVLEQMLLDAGYRVDTAGTMMGGLHRLADRNYDLLVADGKLPDGTGVDLCDDAVRRGVPCFIVTGYAFVLPQDKSDYEILQKPVRGAELIAAVERHLA